MGRKKYLWSYTNDTKTQFWSSGTSQCYFSYECKNNYMPDNLINNRAVANITLPEKLPSDIFQKHAVLAAGILTAKRDYYHSRPKYPYHILLIILRGKLSCRINDKKFELPARTIVSIPSGTLFEEHVGCAECRELWIHLNPDSAWNAVLGREIGLRKSRNFDDIISAADIMRREIYAKSRSMFFLENIIAVFYELVRREFFGESDNRNETDALGKLAAEVKNFPNRNWSRFVAAKSAACKECVLDRYFVSRHSRTFAKYLLDARMAETLKLLSRRNLTFSEIAERTGYADQSSLSKAFKKYYGKSLKKYREIENCES